MINFDLDVVNCEVDDIEAVEGIDGGRNFLFFEGIVVSQFLLDLKLYFEVCGRIRRYSDSFELKLVTISSL